MSIKAVMFDFDGTLSTPENSNIWNDFWDILGYERTPGSEYARLGSLFFGGEIDYQTGCDLTCEKFMERGVSRSHLMECANRIKMLDNIGDAFESEYVEDENGCYFEIKNVTGRLVCSMPYRNNTYLE